MFFPIGTENLNAVYHECKHCSADWEIIGINLGLSVSTLAIIKRDNPTSCEHCMLQMVSKWLQKESEKCVPSWRSLCQALCDVNRSTADQIAENHNVTDYRKFKGY